MGLELSPSMNTSPASNGLYPVLQENHHGAWGYGCCPPEIKHHSWRGGLQRGRASSLPAGSACIKYLTLIFNFVFSLLGLLSLAAGLWGLALQGPKGTSSGCTQPTDPMLVLVLGGLAVSVVALAGCLGALCESTVLLRCFSVSLLSFLLAEALGGTLIVALWGPIQDNLEHTLYMAIAHYQDDSDLCFLLDWVQLQLRCCGVTSYQDWQQNPYFNCSSPGDQACSLPASCCVHPSEDGLSLSAQCGSGALRPDQASGSMVHLEGCGPRLRWWLRQSARSLGGGLITAVLVQGVELLLATRLLRALAMRKSLAKSAGQTVPWPRSRSRAAEA
ncbi:tetraspanin-10 [Rhynchocyon petersi]